MRRAIAPLLVAAAAIFGCTKVSSDPNVVVALAFDSLPYPAIVGGDTLRDENGAVVTLHASALNSDGETIENPALTFVALDAGVTISPDGIVTSTNPALTSARILAQAGNLQSRTLTLVVTPKPDSMVVDGTVDTLRYVIPDATSNTSGALGVKLLSNTTTPPSVVRGWIVRYSVEFHGSEVPANGDTLAWLVDDNNRRSVEDTTGADGRASRRLRLISTNASFDHELDSIVVIARAVARGAPLAGSPVRMVIPIKPRSF